MESRYLDGRTVMNCSDNTAADVDTEVMKLLKDSYKEAKKLLKENRKLLDKLAEFLIEKETITGKEFMKIYRKEKGLPEPEEKPEEKKPEPNPGRQGQPNFNVPGNYGRPPIPPVGMGGSFQNGQPGMPQGNPYQNGQPGMPQGNPYRNGQPGMPQGNPYQNGQPGMPQGNPYQNGQAGGPQRNPYQNGQPGMPQGNPYQNGQPGMPQGNPYQNGQPGAPQGNPYQNGNGQGPQNTGEQANSRKEAWDAQYRQNHWSNQAENQSQESPHSDMQPGMPQGNPYQNGMLGGMPKPANWQAEPAGQREAAGPDAGGKPGEPENCGPRGAFSGALQESIEKSQDQGFVPYESPEKQEEAAGQETEAKPQEQAEIPETVIRKEVPESAIVDNEQDAEIVLEAAVKALKEEENEAADTPEKTVGETAGEATAEDPCDADSQ